MSDETPPLRAHMPTEYFAAKPNGGGDISYPSMAVACPECDQAAGDPCVTVSGNPKPKDKPHKARVDAFADAGDGE